MSTRTSIRIGSILDSSMRERLPGYEKFLEEYTNQYLLFGYRKAILGHYYATVCFQASKSFGGITCEVGLSRTKEFPYYRYYESPSLGVAGFRARTTHILKGLDSTTTRLYVGPDVLLGHIMDLVGEAITAGNKLIDQAVPRVAEQYNLWQPHYEDWLKQHKEAHPHADGLIYPTLIGEAVARRTLDEILRSGRFDGFLGPKKFRYREPDFRDCHVFLLARALAFEDPPEQDEFDEFVIDPNHDPDKILFDGIAAISGRREQCEALEDLSTKIQKRVPEWAFLRSFAALEAFYDSVTVNLDEVRSHVKEPPKPKEEALPVGVCLDELYGDISNEPAPLAEPLAPLKAEPLPVEVAVVAPKPKMGKDRIDPFHVFKEYIEAKPQAPAADPFELLGSQLGL